MIIQYADKRTEKQCTEFKEAARLFGGDKKMAVSLLARINALEQAEVLKDIIMMPVFHFHGLKGKFNGLFAIDVKSRRDKWRIILLPLNEKKEAFEPCHIDEISASVRIVEIREVSAHYE